METPLGKFTVQDAIDNIFNDIPKPPMSLRFEFATESTETTHAQVQQMLGHFLVTGAKKLYNKELFAIDDDEFNMIRKYLHSIGFDAQKKKVVIEKVVTDYHPNGAPFERTITVNKWEYEFTNKLPQEAMLALQKFLRELPDQ